MNSTTIASIPRNWGLAVETLPACDGVDRGDANDAGSDIGDMRWLLLAGGRERQCPS